LRGAAASRGGGDQERGGDDDERAGDDDPRASTTTRSRISKSSCAGAG